MTSEAQVPATTTDAEQIVETVRAHYAAAARTATDGRVADTGEGCCGDTTLSPAAIYYTPDDRHDLPEAAVLASLGCGNPIAVAELRLGERVLDLGSGGGIDVLLSARRVGPTGKAYGLDMTDEMLALAVRNAAEAGVTNVEFLRGRIESVPLPANTIDVVISNCVINLSTDKPAVFAEMARVLRPGGRIGVADVVAEDSLSPADRAARGSYAGCIAGALSFSEYRAGLEAAGFEQISIERTPGGADGIYSAIVRGRKPLSAGTSVAADRISPPTTLSLRTSSASARRSSDCETGVSTDVAYGSGPRVGGEAGCGCGPAGRG